MIATAASDPRLAKIVKSQTPQLSNIKSDKKNTEFGKASGSSVAAIKSLKHAHNQLFKWNRKIIESNPNWYEALS